VAHAHRSSRQGKKAFLDKGLLIELVVDLLEVGEEQVDGGDLSHAQLSIPMG